MSAFYGSVPDASEPMTALYIATRSLLCSCAMLLTNDTLCLFITVYCELLIPCRCRYNALYPAGWI